MSLSGSKTNLLRGLLVPLILLVVFLQAQIDPLRRQPAIEPPQANKVIGGLKGATLPFENMLGAVSGFRQVIAGLLWVRSDSFFHSGNYDAILPMIRLITWLDPNWLDPYATGAWHITYNFTDTDQRSDRRYLPAGVALLNEGIQSNPDIFDMYKEKGWLYYDKIKDYNESAKALEAGMQHKPDINQVGHLLANAYIRAGKVDEAEKQFADNIRLHKANLADPKANDDTKMRSGSGLKNQEGQLDKLAFRKKWRAVNVNPPIDADLKFQVRRIKPKVIEITGSWNMIGSKGFDKDKGIIVEGPVDGARLDIRLQDEGYQMPQVADFNFELDPSVMIMQDSVSVRGGKKVLKGGLYAQTKGRATFNDLAADKVGVYGFNEQDSAGLGVPLDQALAGKAQISPFGMNQLATVAYPLPYNSTAVFHPEAEVPALFNRLKNDPGKIAELTKKGFCIAVKDSQVEGTFKKEIDMSKDPKMYGFAKDKYELILSFNPRYTSDFVKDRLGWNGEGLSDKRYLDTTTIPGARILRVKIPITKDDLLGNGEKVIMDSK